jgi:hypothetical protein
MNDGDRTLLDSTTVLFGSGMGDGNSHKNSDLPILLAGGGYKHGEFREVPARRHQQGAAVQSLRRYRAEDGRGTDSFGSSTGRFA